MKKSFKKVVAVLLAVMMVVCSFPLTVLAADDNKANINLRFGDISSSSTATKNYTVTRNNNSSNFIKNSGLNSAELTYSNGKISGYGVGDYFTVSVLVENISKLSSAEVALKYSDSIVPAYIKTATSGTATLEYTETGSAVADFKPLEAVTAQSGNAIYNTTSTVGETSYIDADNKVIHANFAVQTGADDIDVSSTKAVGTKCSLTNAAVLATFMFKIVSDDAITFSIDKSSDTFYLNTIANGGSTDEYKTYAPKVEGEDPELTFMGENEYVEPTTKSYTITFVDADGKTLSTGKYEEGTSIVAPQLPAVTHDDAKHYTYAWDKEIPATATADGTYTIVKTGADHTWNEGVVTKEPTTTEFGEKTYTCTLDGCGATKTEQLPKKEEAHVHHYTWTYDDSQLYYNKLSDRHDGEIVGTCAECGDVKREVATDTSKLRTGTYTLVLDNSLTINFRITKTNVTNFKNIKVKAKTKFSNPEVMEFDEPVKDADGYYQYTIGLPPQYVKDDIDVVAYSTVTASDGQEVEVWGPTYSRSVLTYANSVFASPTYTSDSATERNKVFRGMIVDILNYAAAAQVKASYDTADLANANLTDTQKSWASADIQEFNTVKNFAAEPNANRTARFAAGALSLEDAVIPRMTFALKADSVQLKDITVQATVAGQTFTYTPASDPENFQDYRTNVSGALGTENRYYFYFTDILANQMSETIEFRIFANGILISDVCTYSVESYVQQAYPVQGQTDKDLLMSMMKYGKAAEKYGKM